MTRSGGSMVSWPVATIEMEHQCGWCGMKFMVSMIAEILLTHLGMGLPLCIDKPAAYYSCAVAALVDSIAFQMVGRSKDPLDV